MMLDDLSFLLIGNELQLTSEMNGSWNLPHIHLERFLLKY
jgi:hypothetical protein